MLWWKAIHISALVPHLPVFSYGVQKYVHIHKRKWFFSLEPACPLSGARSVTTHGIRNVTCIAIPVTPLEDFSILNSESSCNGRETENCLIEQFFKLLIINIITISIVNICFQPLYSTFSATNPWFPPLRSSESRTFDEFELSFLNMASKLVKSAFSGSHTAGIYADMTVDGPEIGTLVVVVDRAKNLPNRRTMGKQDPYCAARLGKEARKTETDKRGGQTPRW